MGEHNSDLYEQQLYAVFESCLTKGKNELEESNLSFICSKLHLDGLTEELKSCICKHADKQTISFQEFRDGLLVLLKKFQGLITDRQCIVQPHYNLNTCNVDIKKNELTTSVNNVSKVHLQEIDTRSITMDESKLIRFWEKIKVYLRDYTDSTAIQFILSCAGIPELPRQMTEFIFERLDQNCDGLISFDEFVIIFQKRRRTEALREHSESHSSIVNCSVNTLDFNVYEPHESDSVQCNKSIGKEEVAGVSRPISTISPSRDLSVLDTSLVEVTNIICDELKSLNESLDDDAIQSHITLLREMLTLYQNEQRNLSVLIENMKAEKEKMRIDMLEANERANLLAQEIDEHQAQLEKTKESLQKQSQQRYAEITKELSNQLNIEREIDAAALKSKDEQLQLLQRENHDMKNKLINTLQDNQMLEAENGTLLSQIEKLRQSNNDLLTRMKILDAEHDEIQSLEAKQQEQVDFFVDRIKQLQSEATLLRDQNDELNAELETLKCHSNETRQDEAPSSLAYDLQLDETPDENHVTSQSFQDARQADVRVSFGFKFSPDEGQLDTSNPGNVDVEKLKNTVVKDLENMLMTSTKCASEKCALSDNVARLISNLQLDLPLHCSTRDFGKSLASELEMECEERAHESLRDLVVSKAPKSLPAKRTTMSSSAEDLDDFTDQEEDIKSATQSKTTSLRDYPPRKEEHPAEQCRINKEKDNSLNIIEVENVPKNVSANAGLQELEVKHTIEKKQLTERCSELERSLDLLRAEYEECEDYWAAKLEEERQLFEQEQKISDDKLAELINKIAEYEELISPLDKSKSNGRLSPIDERFNLEQQYIDLEEEFEKWKTKAENEISQKNVEIGDLREKLRLAEQLVTNDSWVQVPDEISLRTLSNLSHCKSSSASSIPSMNEPVENLTDLQTSDTNNQTYCTSEHPSSNDSNRLIKLTEDQTDSYNLNITRDECSTKEIKTTHKDKKSHMYQKSSHVGTKVKEGDKRDPDFTWMQDVLMQSLNGVSCHCVQNNTQKRMCCIDLNVLQNLNMKFYAQERKKRQLQHYFKRQQQQVEKVLQRIMTQHQTELFELQCLLRNTQERLQVQVQTTVDQADRLANADILVKDLYIENACLTEHIKRLQERCLILSGLNMETTSM